LVKILLLSRRFRKRIIFVYGFSA